MELAASFFFLENSQGEIFFVGELRTVIPKKLVPRVFSGKISSLCVIKMLQL
jgi:hypothetical protein